MWEAGEARRFSEDEEDEEDEDGEREEEHITPTNPTVQIADETTPLYEEAEPISPSSVPTTTTTGACILV